MPFLDQLTRAKHCRQCKAIMTDKEPRYEICGACRLRRDREGWRDWEDPEWFKVSLRRAAAALRLKST